MLKAGYLTIPLGGYIELAKEELEHSDVLHAIRRKWITIEDKIPAVKTVTQKIEDFAATEMDQGMTSEELAAELKSRNETPSTTTEDISDSQPSSESSSDTEPAGKKPSSRKSNK